jgi:hypothetical protein
MVHNPDHRERLIVRVIRGYKGKKGQSFVELAIVLPLLLFMLIGFVEVGALIYNYLSILDASREAARFASEHDPEILEVAGAGGHCEDDNLHFYQDTACVITDPDFNPGLTLDPATDDVTISVFWVKGNTFDPSGADGDKRLPNDGDGVWSKYSDNWTKKCDGTIHSTTPFMQNAQVNDKLSTMVAAGTPTPPPDKGMVLVEVYFCHHNILGLPLLDQFIPDPIRLHAYTFMPAPQVQPTPTPITPSAPTSTP